MADDPELDDTVAGLRNGDFSRLAPRFEGDPPAIARWIGALDDDARAEALSCAAFNGAMAAIELLLARGVPAQGGAATGLDALHWAVNRGQRAAVERLLRAGATVESMSMHDTTAIGTAVWSALHEPRAEHGAIIDLLLASGAATAAVDRDLLARARGQK